MRESLLVIVLFAAGVPVAGCTVFGSKFEVIVTDPEGAPISGAAVSPVTPSMNGATRLTDETGKATIPRNQIQEVQWVGVKADGFVSQQVAVPRDSVLRITMSKRVQAEEYVFLAKLTKVDVLEGSEKPVFATGDIDPRWVAEFTVTRIEKGNPPNDAQGLVRYAIHSPAQRNLTDNAGRIYRVSGKLVPGGGSPHHEVAFELW